MSALLHITDTPHFIKCVGLYDAEPVRGGKMDQYITDYICAYAATCHDQYVATAQAAHGINAHTNIIQPPIEFKYQRVQQLPHSFASYPIGSVLALQEDDFTVKLCMVVNRDVGWIRTNIRHRTISLGACKLIPVEQTAAAAWTREKLTATAQNHVKQMAALEQDVVRLVQNNEILEEKCQRLLQCARAEVGDKVAFAALNDTTPLPPVCKMSYTPI